MHVPGFTAELSLGPASGVYRGTNAPERVGGITPQLGFGGDPDLGSYLRCRRNGGSDLICRFFAGLPPFTIGRLSVWVPLAPPKRKSVFLSYARKDAAALAGRLRHDLTASGLDVWLDTVALEGGQSWTQEIERTLDRADAVVTLMTAASYLSDICRAEHLRALRKGRRVVPVLAEAGTDRQLYFEHLSYVDFSAAAAYPESLAGLLRAIFATQPVPLVPAPLLRTRMTVPPLPLNFVARPAAEAAIRSLLLTDADDRPVTGIRGMPGNGKTVLAQAVCVDDLKQAAFPDGIAWVRIGRRPGDLASRVRAIGTALGDDSRWYATRRSRTRPGVCVSSSIGRPPSSVRRQTFSTGC
jgi:TIR domain/NB-ARC domain